MNGIYPQYVGPTVDYRHQSLYPAWTGIVQIEGVLLGSSVCATAYWAKYENAAGIFDAANVEVIATDGLWAASLQATGLFRPTLQVDGLMVKWEHSDGGMQVNIPTGGVFGRDIVAAGLIDGCN